jgi:hypothetical protein
MRQTTRALALAGLGVAGLVGPATPATGVGDDIRRTTEPFLWVLSATTAVAGLVSVLCSDFGTISRFVSGVGDRATGVALGALFAVVLAIPALRILPSADTPPEQGPPPPTWQRVLGVVLLLALLAWPVLAQGEGGQFEPRP